MSYQILSRIYILHGLALETNNQKFSFDVNTYKKPQEVCAFLSSFRSLAAFVAALYISYSFENSHVHLRKNFWAANSFEGWILELDSS